ncbi:MAG: long-chain fatty acid--CoA ligase [Candidatus Lokiarchaeota archaeon]|nr:long-chain fatty acid--CoA ligase [Candidatus Lokiarchaeota archaeon]
MYGQRIWKKHWDAGVDDLPASAWETTYTRAIRPAFEKFPGKMAFEFLGVEITFSELDMYSNQFANMLIANGFTKGDIVAINQPNTPQFVIAYIGTLKAGCVVSGLSPLLSEEQMKYQLNDLGTHGKKVCLVTLDIVLEKRFSKIAADVPATTLVVASSIAAFLPKIKQVLGKALKKIPSGKVAPVAGKTVLDFMHVMKTAPKTLPAIDITPDDTAYIMYTGGTTGPSKGAIITHRNLMADLLIVHHWLKWQPGAGLAVSGFPFFHMGGLFFLENCMYLGWSLPLIPDPRNVKHMCSVIKKYKPDVLLNVPTLFQMLLKSPEFRAIDHSTVKYMISGAAPFPKESQEELESVVGRNKLIELYGMTEVCASSMMNPVVGRKKLGTVGLPLPNIDLKLVDPVSRKDVPLGEPGEICVRGPMVFKGYLNKPEETANAIDVDGFVHTGDVGVMDEDGYIKIVDRTKDMINVGGYKVFSAKVENVLSEHPAVDLIALIGVPNPERPGSEIVKAYVQLRPDFSQPERSESIKQDLIAYAKQHCTPHETPKYVEIVNPMPLTSIGKVDKKVLRASARIEARMP